VEFELEELLLVELLLEDVLFELEVVVVEDEFDELLLELELEPVFVETGAGGA